MTLQKRSIEICWEYTKTEYPEIPSVSVSYTHLMNEWMKTGVKLDNMMPYLSKYLGHSSPDDTFYYYHQVEEAFSIIRQKDQSAAFVIPEVTDEK